MASDSRMEVGWLRSRNIAAQMKWMLHSGRAEMPPLRIGQMTSWARDKGYAEGMGQRDLALSMPDGSSSIVGFLGIASMTFDNPMRATVGGVGRTASYRSAEPANRSALASSAPGSRAHRWCRERRSCFSPSH